MEIEAKLNAMDSKQYYRLGGLSVLSTSNEDDGLSEAGSEDVDTIPHRYDPPTEARVPYHEQILTHVTSGPTTNCAKSLAEEIRESYCNHSTQESQHHIRQHNIAESSIISPKYYRDIT